MESASPLPQLAQLCARCKALELNEAVHDLGSDDTHQYREIKLGWELADQIPEMSQASKRREKGWGGGYGLACLRVKFRSDEGKDIVYFDCPIASATRPLQNSAVGLATPLTQLDSDRIRWITSKLEACVAHDHLTAQPGFVPDRLIKVDQGQLRLVLTNDAGNSDFHPPPGVEPPRYAALTYCWGPLPHADKQLKTQTGNLSQHLREIPASKLPLVVKDAVSAARALTIPYLWVDALCILQDVGSDWEAQCMQMDKIYSNAYLTISAPVSNNCEEGFVDRSDRVVLPLHQRRGPTTPIMFAIYQPSCSATSAYEIAATTWIERGWTLQERLSSTRMVFFGRNNIHFQCIEGHCSMGRFQLPCEFGMLNRRLINQGSPSVLHKEWADVAAECSCVFPEFTRPTDLWPSIAGIATLFAERLRDEYLAGLWKGDLSRSLHWTGARSNRPKYADLMAQLEHPSQYIAPSWSWGSHSTLVSFSLYADHTVDHCRPEYSILRASVKLKGANPFGELESAHLDISAKVYTGSRRLVFDELKDTGGISRQTLRLEGRYLTDFEADCESEDLFDLRDGQYGLEAPVSFLLIGSTVNEDSSSRPDRFHGSPSSQKKLDDDLYGDSRREPEVPDACHPGGEYLGDGFAGEKPRAASPCLDVQGPPRSEEKTGKYGAAERVAYGLMIHPANKPGEFYRLGAFFSEPYGRGGLAFFDGCETRAIRLI
ncbi:heterokaryon incompatibility protein [Hirsutella rhossiliensis]|uniref:Heterokaryon incompatibility protein (HET) domain-containing protein n=1 Tax=Hirsutella rhossiliensis TaxID=111463 RepID=A0A9P8MYJ3_9HYPO|nr:heterokaryon incompatibility protein (HET) domain-containing protein [Hirsutella rhossiliensis]KAH0963579.1 heterokaryon incompatibility protein (HET) domain-containing protein [Hirsutella rhossiliensis]